MMNPNRKTLAVEPSTIPDMLIRQRAEAEEHATNLMTILSQTMIMLENGEPHHIILSSIQDQLSGD